MKSPNKASSWLEENNRNKGNHSSPSNPRSSPHFMMSTQSDSAHHRPHSSAKSPSHGSHHASPSRVPPRVPPKFVKKVAPTSGNLKEHQKHVQGIQQIRKKRATMLNAPVALPLKAGGDSLIRPSAVNASDNQKRAQGAYNERLYETPESIKRDRDRLLKEKQQWLTHVKKETDTLMSLLHDVRLGKNRVQVQMDALTEERNEIKTLKMDNTVHRFERILSELPLGERGTYKRDAEPLENQHRTDGVHSLMCSIARRARAAQERAIQELVAAIKATEEHFLKGGDITIKVHELKTMAEGGYMHEDLEPDEEVSKKSESSSGADMPNSRGSSSASRNPKRTSMFGLRKGISFKMNSTANVIAAMTNQQKEMDGKINELEEERDKWKLEYVNLRRKMMKMKVINAITKIGRAAASQNGQAAQINFQRSTDFVIPDGTKGWDSLPENWKIMAQKCLKNHIKTRMSQHARTQWVDESHLNIIATEASTHMQEIFGHMLYTTASSVAGRTASEVNMQHLCDAVLNSLAMERELYPLLTMYLTYTADSPYIVDREEEEEEQNEGAIEEEIKELEEIQERISQGTRAAVTASVGSGFSFSRTETRETPAVPVSFPKVVPTTASKSVPAQPAQPVQPKQAEPVQPKQSPAQRRASRRESFNPDTKFEVPEGDEFLYEGIGGLD